MFTARGRKMKLRKALDILMYMQGWNSLPKKDRTAQLREKQNIYIKKQFAGSGNPQYEPGFIKFMSKILRDYAYYQSVKGVGSPATGKQKHPPKPPHQRPISTLHANLQSNYREIANEFEDRFQFMDREVFFLGRRDAMTWDNFPAHEDVFNKYDDPMETPLGTMTLWKYYRRILHVDSLSKAKNAVGVTNQEQREFEFLFEQMEKFKEEWKQANQQWEKDTNSKIPYKRFREQRRQNERTGRQPKRSPSPRKKRKSPRRKPPPLPSTPPQIPPIPPVQPQAQVIGPVAHKVEQAKFNRAKKVFQAKDSKFGEELLGFIESQQTAKVLNTANPQSTDLHATLDQLYDIWYKYFPDGTISPADWVLESADWFSTKHGTIGISQQIGEKMFKGELREPYKLKKRVQTYYTSKKDPKFRFNALQRLLRYTQDRSRYDAYLKRKRVQPPRRKPKPQAHTIDPIDQEMKQAKKWMRDVRNLGAVGKRVFRPEIALDIARKGVANGDPQYIIVQEISDQLGLEDQELGYDLLSELVGMPKQLMEDSYGMQYHEWANELVALFSKRVLKFLQSHVLPTMKIGKFVNTDQAQHARDHWQKYANFLLEFYEDTYTKAEHRREQQVQAQAYQPQDEEKRANSVPRCYRQTTESSTCCEIANRSTNHQRGNTKSPGGW